MSETRDPYQPKIPCLPKIPVIPRSQSIQDPSHPKIPVNPRSQSAQDPSQPKIPVSTGCPHAYLAFGSCLFGIWLMQLYLAHVKFTSTKFFKHILHMRANLGFVCIFSFRLITVSFNTVIISRHFQTSKSKVRAAVITRAKKLPSGVAA